MFKPTLPLCHCGLWAVGIDTSLSSKGDTFSGLGQEESQSALNVIFHRMHQDDGAKSSIKMFANIFISFIGAGILGMPHAFKEVCKVLAFPRSSTVLATNAYLENEGFGQLNRRFLSHQAGVIEGSAIMALIGTLR